MAHLIAAVATGREATAIGIVRLTGDGCFDAVEKIFVAKNGKKPHELPSRLLTFGTLLDEDGKPLDEVLLTVSRAPYSYTGEDTAELQCHGAPAVLTAALEGLYRAGARPAGPGEFTRRAFLNGKLDLSQAEAVMDLIDATTVQAAKNAAGQLGGALLRKITPICDGITDILAHFHAVLDYSDEDLPPFQLAQFRKTLAGYRDTLVALEQSYRRGRFLRSGVPAVILGRPNAGKSSLLNALAGYERVIVTDIPGTTRDTVAEAMVVGGTLLRLTDTAGIRETEDKVEKQGVERSLRAAEEAELSIFVCDSSCPLDENDHRAMEEAKKAPHSIAVLNKCDLAPVVKSSDLPFETVLTISAKEGTGLEDLEKAVAEIFAQNAPADGSILTNARQYSAVLRGRTALDNLISAMDMGLTPDAVLTDAEEALSALDEITGRSMREDIVSRIFERFCVGK
ncbi:MAG: tRNA uridine-5-carboxymethylaminomethyl(34) synthesis GTPase MnmE [Oscillospiraceae bacterium]|nr:tRNA uridine-5-carboxymethylaminomethyl(34) synthesis GTPase MnmE [Oscillospiraceae bacterium]